MIVSIILGRRGSEGFPGKNTFLVLGREIASYPMEAAQRSQTVSASFLSTDCQELRDLGARYGHEVINRPSELCTSAALAEDAYQHAVEHIEKLKNIELDIVVLLFCNAVMVTGQMIDMAVEKLKANPKADSVVSVSKYNMYSPLRARRLNSEGFLEPYVDLQELQKTSEAELSCDRDSQGDVYFADVSLVVARRKNFTDLNAGQLPQKWMGKKILPIENEAGLDIDYEWQLGQLEYWLRKNKKV
jgi:CMP-N-acetylneuraminic acid synthetase